MGRLLKRISPTHPRTVLASLLTVVAVALPSTAFYFVGNYANLREAARMESQALERATGTAQILAEKLSSRLEFLMTLEDQRPFYHYQNLYHDPRGAHEGASIVPSPLRDGAGDPLIRTHFQINPDGEVALPSLNDEVPEMSCGQKREVYRSMQRALGPAAPFCCDDGGKAAPSHRRVVLSARAWEQNLAASALYADIRGGRADTGPAVASRSGPAGWPRAEFERGGPEGAVEIFIESLAWRTVPLEDGPVLAALRRVDTPAGRLTQGFMVCPQAVKEWLKGAELPVEFRHEEPEGFVGTALALGETSWSIVADPSGAIEATRQAARTERIRFHTLFLVCVFAAGIAGLFVVLMVWQAETLADQRSRFAASAAHELRTPLAGIRMYGEMISEGLGDPSRAGTYAGRISEEAQRLGRVVSNVLGMSRLERGKVEVKPVRGSIGEVLDKCVATQRPALENKGARIAVKVEPNLPEVSFDPDALCQILHNLLDNAEKFSRASDNRMIDVSVDQEESGVVVSVADRGPGISRSFRRRIFRPFSRGREGAGPEGLGLGLTMVESLAEGHGGRVWCEDRPGGGAIFRVIFPQ